MKLRRGVSSGLNYGSLFQDWEIAVAKKLIKRFQLQWSCLPDRDFDDLLQECLTHWLFSRDNYDPSREASKKTFMGRIVQNKLTDIVRERESDKRKAAYRTTSIDEPVQHDKDSRTLLDKIEKDKVAEWTPDLSPRVLLKVDLSRASKQLTPRQKELCRLLQEGYNMKEASKILKTPRTTLYDEVERIKTLFCKENLQDYLD